MNKFDCINPLDSRYSGKIKHVSNIFSEFNLTRIKVDIEFTYFRFLVDYSEEFGIDQLKSLRDDDFESFMKESWDNFGEADMREIALLEKETNHDIKAIEYYVKTRLSLKGVNEEALEFVHFGLTSQDIVSLSYAIALKQYLQLVYHSELSDVTRILQEFSKSSIDDIIIAKTHGQQAIPTSIGRELGVFINRLHKMQSAYKFRLGCKFGGAIGNMAAHKYSYQLNSAVSWESYLSSYCSKTYGIERTYSTTQTDNYDSLASTFDCMRQLALILIDLCRDVWQYISNDYFKLEVTKTFVGSSTMPQKINPIDFENAEGNLEIVVMWLEFLNRKLRISRLQRDLSDSTVMRNLGVPFGHFSLALQSLKSGLSKLSVNKETIEYEIEHNYQVLAEAVQIELKKNKTPDAYELIKQKFIGRRDMDRAEYRVLIDSLQLIDQKVHYKLLRMTPKDYFYK